MKAPEVADVLTREFGRAIIEYKPPASLNARNARRTAAVQALAYLDDETMAADVVIITDGSVWAHYRDASAPLEIGEQGVLPLFPEPTPPHPEERFLWRDNGPDHCARILSLIATVRMEAVTPSAVAKKLGTDRPEVLAVIRALGRALASRTAGDRADILFQQWIQLAGVSYGIDHQSASWPQRKTPEELLEQCFEPLRGCSYAESLFTLHTYVALTSKLIGLELLSLGTGSLERRPTSWLTLNPSGLENAIKSMEDGSLPSELRAPNLLAGDLFGWYSRIMAESAEVASSIRSLLRILNELSWARVASAAHGMAGDLLRDFYVQVVPRPLRRALGEFFTPQWLAERTLYRGVTIAMLDSRPARILDPACGSGTFLVAALKRELFVQDALMPGETGEATRRALASVIGFDINPVAVAYVENQSAASAWWTYRVVE